MITSERLVGPHGVSARRRQINFELIAQRKQLEIARLVWAEYTMVAAPAREALWRRGVISSWRAAEIDSQTLR
eukprot:7464559-Pyramimonas_sp.AAC.1